MAVFAWETSAGDAAHPDACVKAVGTTMKALVLESCNRLFRLSEMRAAIQGDSAVADQNRGKPMISGYSDHAANERTFLAWVRTGIAVTAFGFVIQKFNLFMLTIATASLATDVHHSQLAGLAGRFGRYEGLALIFGGVALVVVSTVRFVRTTRALDDTNAHAASSVRAELILSGGLVLLIASYSIYLALQ
jgi:putative membrane protein